MEEQGIDGATQETLAIVFGDLVGLDVLTAQLGDLRTNSLRQQFFDQTRKLIEQHGGELVKTVGDGLLAVFPQVGRAVEFAIETQELLKSDPFGLQPGQLNCRFGIHFASIRVKRTAEGLDIFGWEVSYAARLLQLQQTSDLLISEAAFQRLPARLSRQFLEHREPLGPWSSDRPGVWSYRGSLHEPKTSPPIAGLPTQIGRYEIIRKLGEGGIGLVYLCRDETGREVSIKTLKPGLPDNVKRRFREEGNRADLVHENFVTIYEVGEHDAVPYIATEFVPGESLDRILQTGRKLTLIEKLDIVNQTCKGLDYAHSKGVIHGDIKPENIIRIRDNGRIKIVDFGISKVKRELDTAGLSQTLGIVGTVGYIAPERWLSGPEDGRADIWAVGVILYCLLTGQEPFVHTPGEGPFAIMKRILEQPFPPLSMYLKDFPEGLTHVLERALAKDPNERYLTAKEFADDLALLTHELNRRQIPELLAEVQRCLAEGNWQQARKRGQEALKIDPQNSDTRRLLREIDDGRKGQDESLLDSIVSEGRFFAAPRPFALPPAFRASPAASSTPMRSEPQQTQSTPVPTPPRFPPLAPAGPGEYTRVINRLELGADPSSFTQHIGRLASPSFQLDLSTIECASEAIVVIDIVQATATSDLFGWYAVGRVLIRELREYVREIGSKYDMCCVKSTGDGFLLTYRNEDSAEVAAVQAVKASHELLTQLAVRNRKSPEQRKIAIRLALHFGEVDILPDDRQGPNISYAFRVEAISRASLLDAINPIDPPDRFPLRDYIICSERVCEIVDRHLPDWSRTSCGLFKLKGFTGWGELFLLSQRADA